MICKIMLDELGLLNDDNDVEIASDDVSDYFANKN